MKRIIGIAVFIVVLVAKLILDHHLWKVGVVHDEHLIKHGPEIAVVAAILIPSCVFLLGRWWYSIPMLMAWWWLLFDGIFNLIRHQPFFFSGQNNDGIIDSFLQRIPDWTEAAIKMALILVFTFLYFGTGGKNRRSG